MSALAGFDVDHGQIGIWQEKPSEQSETQQQT